MSRRAAPPRRDFFRYLPVHPESRAAGTYLPAAGFSSVAPGSAYPPTRHPTDHHFTWQHGRVLSAHQFVYVTRGRGRFESQRAGAHAVQPGDLIVVHPGIWHRYRPEPETGWDEYWVEFGGAQALRLLDAALADPAQPVHRLGHRENLVAALLETLELLRTDPPEGHLLLSAQAIRIVALVRSALRSRVVEGRPVEDIVREAKALLTRGAGRRIGLESLAAQLGLSYSHFRRLFREHTGFAPRQYALQETLRQAMLLLTNTRRPVAQIALDLGYSSVFFFSRQFARMSGMPPLRYRRTHAGGEAARPATRSGRAARAASGTRSGSTSAGGRRRASPT